MTAYGPAADERGSSRTDVVLAHIAVTKANAMHNTDQRVAVWLAATGRIVRAMVASGCFGPKDRMWVAVCYLQVLVDLCTRFSFRGAALYDQAMREMGDEDPNFGEEHALPFYKALS